MINPSPVWEAIWVWISSRLSMCLSDACHEWQEETLPVGFVLHDEWFRGCFSCHWRQVVPINNSAWRCTGGHVQHHRLAAVSWAMIIEMLVELMSIWNTGSCNSVFSLQCTRPTDLTDKTMKKV
jgi:hypothetical protein